MARHNTSMYRAIPKMIRNIGAEGLFHKNQYQFRIKYLNICIAHYQGDDVKLRKTLFTYPRQALNTPLR